MELNPDSKSLGKSVDVCISQVKKAHTKMENIAWKLNTFESDIKNISVQNKPEESVMMLLGEVYQVKEDYEKLKQDLYEVHELQRNVQDTIRYNAHHVHKKYRELRKKLESKNLAESSSVNQSQDFTE